MLERFKFKNLISSLSRIFEKFERRSRYDIRHKNLVTEFLIIVVCSGTAKCGASLVRTVFRRTHFQSGSTRWLKLNIKPC